jgi:hypothetical protein
MSTRTILRPITSRQTATRSRSGISEVERRTDENLLFAGVIVFSGYDVDPMLFVCKQTAAGNRASIILVK